MKRCAHILCGILCFLTFTLALENRHRQWVNTEFLLNEGAQPNNGPKNNKNQDYVAQIPPVTRKSTSTTAFSSINSGPLNDPAKFPPLGPPVTPKSTSTTVSRTINSLNNPHSSSGKRDYVAPQLPTAKPSSTVTNSNNAGSQNNRQSSDGKRDYVAQFPALKPVQNRNGGVKDLINYYEKIGNNQGPSGVTSQGSTNKHGQASTTNKLLPITTVSPVLSTKPMSFSSIVAGSNKPGTTISTTVKPINPGARPVAPFMPLPSSIANKNRGTSANNGHSITDSELQILSEELLRKDSNNAARYITINFQGKTTSQSQEDKAPQPLITISPEVWAIPTVQKFLPLLDNYERDVSVNEHVTPQERIEEIAFMDAVMSTSLMRHLMLFLKNKGYVSPDPQQQKDFVKQLWFSLYSRGKGKLSSSGFEHTFVSELKNGEISGLHNWIYFHREEAANRVNYLGYLKYLPMNENGVVLKFHFNQQGVDKPVNSMFIGTSPELELALYTLCYITRLDNDCNLKLGGKDVNIITYNYRYRSKNYVGTAFPQI